MDSERSAITLIALLHTMSRLHGLLINMRNCCGRGAAMVDHKRKFTHLRRDMMRGMVEILKEKKRLENRDLVKYLRRYAGEPIPKELIEYACQVIEGKIKPLRGRKPE